MPMLSDLQLVYIGPRNSTELLKINTTKFQVEREPVYSTHTSFFLKLMFINYYLKSYKQIRKLALIKTSKLAQRNFGLTTLLIAPVGGRLVNQRQLTKYQSIKLVTFSNPE